MPNLISIPAGRLQRRDESSKWVDAEPTKGELVVSFDEADELLWLRECHDLVSVELIIRLANSP